MSDEHRLEELRGELEAQKLPDSVTGLPGRAQEAAQEAAHTAREQAGRVAGSVSGMIREKPFAAVAAALGAGYLVGWIRG